MPDTPEMRTAALDGAVPDAAARAFRQAQEAALAAGVVVTVIDETRLVELQLVDGAVTRRVIASGVRAAHPVQAGAHFRL